MYTGPDSIHVHTFEFSIHMKMNSLFHADALYDDATTTLPYIIIIIILILFYIYKY